MSNAITRWMLTASLSKPEYIDDMQRYVYAWIDYPIVQNFDRGKFDFSDGCQLDSQNLPIKILKSNTVLTGAWQKTLTIHLSIKNLKSAHPFNFHPSKCCAI